MKIMIDELLKCKGKTRYWLAKELGMTYPNLCKLANNETQSMKFQIIEKCCLLLDCTPNELLGWN